MIVNLSLTPEECQIPENDFMKEMYQLFERNLIDVFKDM